MKPSPVLLVDRLSKSYGGVHALRELSFSVHAGEKVAVIGPNGAGKTTLFNVLNGQLAADSGTVLFEAAPITGLEPQVIARRGVGRTFQVPATFASMTVRENVQLALAARRNGLRSPLAGSRALDTREASAVLERTGIASLAERSCATLAYGDLKRVELAIALACRPRLLLMDEPTAGLAPAERASLMRLVVELAATGEVALLFTEHDMDVVFAHADRVLVLNRGRLISAGPPAAVRTDPHVRRVYLGPSTQPGTLRDA
ncbi:MAG TPA: ABC transporter ATP-binding protein [Casimicrobiaceae bacterium]|nr:ABC transporter ATP-binding protein [Casimicrobiaceae bacterium]